MSEYCREQHPLLCEEASEEELYSPRYYQRIRPPSYRGRTRNNLRGAAAIFTRWSDHWTSFLTYWWIGIGMISLTTFIIYNSLFAFSMLPSANMKPANLILVQENERTTIRSTPTLPEVYMHVFLKQNEDLDINKYMPYIEIISNTFTEYKFHFIVVINDTNIGWMSAEENNELALNMLLTKDKNTLEKEITKRNINIEHITLSTFMDNSPLKKYWRTLPHQHIEFVARAISIWDKGGVAFNPDIITPKFQHTIYINKLQKILNNYAHTNKVIDDTQFFTKVNKGTRMLKNVNNIRDIIDALEIEDKSANAFPQETLSEAEDIDIQFIRHTRQVPNSINHDSKNSTMKMSLSSLFRDFLFSNKADIKAKPTDKTETNRTKSVTNRTIHNAITTVTHEENYISENIVKQTDTETKHLHKPLVVSAPSNFNKPRYEFDFEESHESDEKFESNKLTIDLKGNIIATDTPCHAFLGTIFSNVIHHSEEESITDFIIAELTIFCKGLLSSCMGIDLILL